MKISQAKRACELYSHSIRFQRSRTRTPSPKKRFFGQEIDPNIQIDQMNRARRTAYGCIRCGIYLCDKKHNCQGVTSDHIRPSVCGLVPALVRTIIACALL